MATITFNTGRKYAAEGQVIIATLHDDGFVTFMDHSRQVDGQFKLGRHCDFNKTEVMHWYDSGRTSSTERSRQDGMQPGGCNTKLALASAQADEDAMAEALKVPFVITHRTADGIFLRTETVMARDMNQAIEAAKVLVTSGLFSIHSDKSAWPEDGAKVTTAEYEALNPPAQRLIDDLTAVDPRLGAWAMRKAKSGETPESIRTSIFHLVQTLDGE